MKYLFDVHVFVAFGVINHSLNVRVTDWILANASSVTATCAITELGFVRVISQSYGLTVAEAQKELSTLKGLPYLSWEFLGDSLDVSGLPGGVKAGKQTTDGHLVPLAQAHGALPVTLDAKIPGAFVIP